MNWEVMNGHNFVAGEEVRGVQTKTKAGYVWKFQPNHVPQADTLMGSLFFGQTEKYRFKTISNGRLVFSIANMQMHSAVPYIEGTVDSSGEISVKFLDDRPDIDDVRLKINYDYWVPFTTGFIHDKGKKFRSIDDPWLTTS